MALLSRLLSVTHEFALILVFACNVYLWGMTTLTAENQYIIIITYFMIIL
jgi:hypothetical protein